MPAPGEPGSETWSEASLAHPSGATWMTGYDTLIWPVDSPGPDLIGDHRPGDNLYTFDHRQDVAVAAGSDVIAFALPQH